MDWVKGLTFNQKQVRLNQDIPTGELLDTPSVSSKYCEIISPDAALEKNLDWRKTIQILLDQVIEKTETFLSVPN